MSKKTALVLGATGMVGRTMLRLLAERSWAKEPPVCLASGRSTGRALPWPGGDLACREVTAEAFGGADIALFSAGAAASRQWAPVAAAAGVQRLVVTHFATGVDPDTAVVEAQQEFDGPVHAARPGDTYTIGEER